jgi:hypothetical protein
MVGGGDCLLPPFWDKGLAEVLGNIDESGTGQKDARSDEPWRSIQVQPVKSLGQNSSGAFIPGELERGRLLRHELVHDSKNKSFGEGVRNPNSAVVTQPCARSF